VERIGVASHGTATRNADGSITYQEGPEFHGTDSFTYEVMTAEGTASNGMVSVTVTAVNDAPVAVEDSVTPTDELTLTISAATLIANDSDIDADTLSVSAVGAATHGTTALHADGFVTYTPAVGFTGFDSFSYTISDGRGSAATSSVSVTVDLSHTISFRTAPSAVSVNLATGAATGGAQGGSLTGRRHVVGSSYDDTLTGDDHANRLTGDPGADTVAGGLGDDVYVLNYGDGVDLVHDDHRYTTTSTHEEEYTYEAWVEAWGGEYGPWGYWETRTGTRQVTQTVEVQDDAGSDSLAFAAGITAANLWVKRDGDDLVVGIGGAGATNPVFDALPDRVRLKDWANVKNRVETLRFDDGSTVDVTILYPRLASQPLNLAVGSNGDETLPGTSGDDTFFFRRGDGADVIAASNSTSATDRVVFGGAIDPDQLWFTRRNDDLDVTVVGGGGRVTVRDWYAGAATRVDEFRVADGRMLVESQVQQLVNAMAAFNPPAGSDLRLAPAVREQLEPTLAASWQRPAGTSP
jgi:hypothetical protein